MQYQVTERFSDKLSIKVTMDGSEVERLATTRAVQLLDGGVDPKQAGLKSNVRLLSSLPQFEAIMKLSLQDGYYELIGEISEAEAFVPLDAPHIQLLDADFAGTFEMLFTVPIANGISKVTFEGIEVRYHPIVQKGTEVEDRIKDVCSQFEVKSPEELVEKTDFYPTVEAMRSALKESLDEFVDQVNVRALRDSACDALLRANRFPVADELLEGYVSREIESIVAQIGVEAFASQLERSGKTEQSFRKEVRGRVKDVPRLEIVLDAVAATLPQDVSDVERIAKIEERISQAPDGGQGEDGAAVLSQMKAQPNLVRSLDQSIRRDRAIDHVVKVSSVKKLTEITLDDYMRMQRSAFPLI